jgi:hypothetical protein
MLSGKAELQLILNNTGPKPQQFNDWQSITRR